MPSDSAASNKKIALFSRQTKKALLMSTLIEHNAENEEIIPF